MISPLSFETAPTTFCPDPEVAAPKARDSRLLADGRRLCSEKRQILLRYVADNPEELRPVFFPSVRRRTRPAPE